MPAISRKRCPTSSPGCFGPQSGRFGDPHDREVVAQTEIDLLSSIQTDEARHAQLGFPTLEVLMKHDPKRAQYIFDVSFWRSFRLFQTLTGTSMDYYTPVAQRKMSFKEFMLEWVVHHHERTTKDYGLAKPWYWETFLQCLDHGHHRDAILLRRSGEDAVSSNSARPTSA